jgi:exonuclease III
MLKHNQMKGAFWNIRGLNKVGRVNCLASFIIQNDLDFVGIQETKKAAFSNGLL